MPQAPWSAAVMATMQSQADDKFAAAAALYQSQICPEWVAANLRNRDAGQPLTPAPIAPLHTMFHWDEQAQAIAQVVVSDPSLVPPTLPTVAPTLGYGTLGKIASGNPQQFTDQQAAMLQATLSAVLAIKQKLGA